MIWLAPIAVALVLAAPVALALRRAAREAAALRRSLVALAALAQPVRELRADVVLLQGTVPALARRTRPPGSIAS